MHITTSEYQTANPFSMKDDRMKERIKKIRFRYSVEVKTEIIMLSEYYSVIFFADGSI